MPLLNVSPYLELIASSISMEIIAVSQNEVEECLKAALSRLGNDTLWVTVGESLLVHPFAVMSLMDDWQQALAIKLCLDVEWSDQVLLDPQYELTTAAFCDLIRDSATAVLRTPSPTMKRSSNDLRESISLSSSSGEPLKQSLIRIARRKQGLRLVSAA